MATDTESTNWGAVSVFSLSGAVGLGTRGTLYVFRNVDTEELYLFALIDIGFGLSAGVKVNQYVRNLYKTIVGNKNLSDAATYTSIPVNRAFSADDLNLASGAEATANIAVVVVGASVTAISAWPFFQGEPQAGAVNNDYFTGVQIFSTTDIGLAAGANYQFKGLWIKLCTIVEEGGEIAMYDSVEDDALAQSLEAIA